MSGRNRWIIVGGGASGLAAAFFLKQRGIQSVILERDSGPGGRIGTLRLGQRSFDAGGKNIGKRYALFREFVASLGPHRFEYFGLNSSQVVDGQVKTFEGRRRWRTLVGLTRGIALKDLGRFGYLLWRVKADDTAGYLGSALSRTLAARFDDHACSAYFSREFCKRVLRPMSVRMNGAEPDEIYLGNLGSNVRMILDSYEQLRDGLAPVLEDARNAYDIRVNTTAESLLVGDRRVCGVRARLQDGKTIEIDGQGVILATAAHAAATIVRSVAPGVADLLHQIAYYPVTLILAEYDRPIFTSSVRAFVFDDGEAVSNAGAYGIHDLNIVRYTFSGRAARALVADIGDGEQLLRAGETALSRHVPCEAGWRRRFAVRQFSPGLCAYAPHHSRLLDAIAHQLEGVPGLRLTGDYVRGASIEACFRAAADCIERLALPQADAAARAVGLPEPQPQL